MSPRRYTLEATSPNACTLRLVRGREIHYWSPRLGGYVRDITNKPGILGDQVCAGLSTRGHTLRWSGHGQLVAVIRSEARSAAGSRTLNLMIENDELETTP